MALDKLTPQEQRILKLIADYMSNKQIAAVLKISPRTVENHRTNMREKLGLSGQHALLKYALEQKSK